MIWSPGHSNLVIILSLLLKCQMSVGKINISLLFRPSVMKGCCHRASCIIGKSACVRILHLQSFCKIGKLWIFGALLALQSLYFEIVNLQHFLAVSNKHNLEVGRPLMCSTQPPIKVLLSVATVSYNSYRFWADLLHKWSS